MNADHARRDFLYGLGSTLGTIALNAMLQCDAGDVPVKNPLEPKPRHHPAKAMSIVLAGGGVKAGHAVGATDGIGAEAVDVAHSIRDFQTTLLHLLGLDDSKQTYFHGKRFKQLSQTGGEVIREIIS